MACLIITAGVILSNLIGVAFAPGDPPYTPEQYKAMMTWAVQGLCEGELFSSFLQCEMIPGLSPQTVRTDHGWWSGIIYAKMRSTPLVVEPSEVRIIWQITKPFVGAPLPDGVVRVNAVIRIVIKFQFEELTPLNSPADKHKYSEVRRNEEQNLLTWYRHDLAPKVYAVNNAENERIMHDVILMERIDGVTLREYIRLSGKMGESEKFDAETNQRLPGLRLLYIHLETMLFLDRLQTIEWRHCDLHSENIMIRKSSQEKIYKLRERVTMENDQMKGDYKEKWIDVLLEARTFQINKGMNKGKYQTSNDHMVFIDAGSAKHVTFPEETVCKGRPDLAKIFKFWETAPTAVDNNPHFTRIKEELKGIFSPLADGKFNASQEAFELQIVIKLLKNLVETEKTGFIEHLKPPVERGPITQKVVGLLERVHLRRPQQQAEVESKKDAAGLSKTQAQRFSLKSLSPLSPRTPQTAGAEGGRFFGAGSPP